MDSVKSDTLHGIKWSGFNSVANTIVNFLLGILLARLLTPADYGVVGMTSIFFALASIFIDGGLGAALIRKQNISEEDASTIFFFNVIVSFFFYLLLFVASPFIAVFLHTPILKDIIRVSALTMVFASFGSIHFTLMTKNVNFKTPALLGIIFSLLNGVLGVCMAYFGFGVWALVWPNVICSLLRTISVWLVSTWKPSLIFSTSSFKSMFSFSSNLVINSFFDKFYNEGTSMLIGRFYTPQMLGYYSRGMGTAQLPSITLFNIVGGVTYPILSKLQDNNETLIYVYSKYIRILSMVSFFVLILMAALAHPLIIFLYSEKWEPVVIFLQLFCIRYLLYHIHAVNWNLLLVKGRSDIALKKEIINKTIKFILLGISLPMGVIAICFAQIIGSLTDLIINTYFAGKVCGLGFRKQMSDFTPYLILSILACMPALALTYLGIDNVVTLMIGSVISITMYCGYLWYTKDDCFIELLRLLQNKFKLK